MTKISTCPPPPQLWLDFPDADEKIEELLSKKYISLFEAEQLCHFKNEGYAIFPEAINPETIDRLTQELLTLHEQSEYHLLRMPKGEVMHPNTPINPPKSRLLDLYVNNETTRRIALAAIIQRFLSLIYEEPPLLFQSLLFTWGTEHSIHVDNSYIVCEPNCALLSCWFALEDIEPGSGELVYYPGSHKLPLITFDNKNRIEWRHKVDGKMAHLEYTDFLKDRASSTGEAKSFLANKGDVIIWHANLVHYGSEITTPNQTRKSLLASYCPSNIGRPNYANFFKQFYKCPWQGAYYSSRRYDLNPEANNPFPVYKK